MDVDEQAAGGRGPAIVAILAAAGVPPELRDDFITAGVDRGGWSLPVADDDCLLLGFASGVAAAATAGDIQRRARGRLRIGVHVGEPLGGTDEIAAVARALSQMADPGQVTVTGVVEGLATGHADLRFEPRARADVPGPGAVAAMPTAELLWQPPLPRRLPLPAPLVAERRGPFVGRGDELAALDAHWAAAAGGRVGVVHVVGDPGVGKTRLAAEFAAAVQEAGGCVLYGRADESLAFAYQPFVEALRGYLVELTADEVGDHVVGTDTGLDQLLSDIAGWPRPVPTEPSSETDPATGRFRLFDAVAGLLGRIARERALLLVLDDIHWADRGSLLLLRHVARSLSAHPALIVLTAREGEPGRSDELLTLLAQLWTEAPVVRLSLGGLSEPEVISLVRATGARSGDDVGREIHRLTDGNCFFARELVRHVAAGPDPSRLPESVVEVVRKRVARLSAGTAEVLRAAAVIGREFAIDVLAAATDRSDDVILDTLEEAAAARLVHEVPSAVDRFAFAHALVRDAVGEELSASRRGRLHHRIGEAIESLRAEDLDPHLVDLARHFCAAPERYTMSKAVQYALAAAQRAQGQFAFEEAVSVLEGARSVLDRVGVAGGEHELALRSDVELALGYAWFGAADPEAARSHFATALELARQLGDRRLVAEAALGVTADGVTAGEVDPAAVSVLREALDGLSDAEASLRVRLLAQLTRELLFTGSPVDSVAVAEEGVSVARASGDPNLLARALGGLHQALLGPGDPLTRLGIADEIVALADTTGDPALLRWGFAYRVIDRWQRRDIGGVVADITAHERAAASMRPPLFQWWAEALRVAHELACARFADAEARIERVHALGQAAGDPNVESTWLMQNWLLRWCQGRLAEVVVAPEPGSPLRAILAVLSDEAAGRDDAARARLASLDARLGDVHRDSLAASTAALAALAAHRLRVPATAGLVADALRSLAGHGIVVATGTVFLGAAETWEGHARAALGDWDGAVSAFDAGLAANRDMAAQTWVVHTTAELAGALTARGGAADRSRAAALAAGAARMAASLGMAAHARALARLAVGNH